MKNLIVNLKLALKYREAIVLLVLAILCFVLSVFRVYLSGNFHYLFLNWNLFLAFIPWLISTKIIITPRWQQNKIILATSIAAWLLFFPNAPYIFTDLFHLNRLNSMPMWFDLSFILLFAWVGLLFGFISLRNVQYLTAIRFSKPFSYLSTTLLLFISSFGVYLGRYQRWNSWDIIHTPSELIYDVAHRLVYPIEHPRTWGMTLIMGVFLNVAYWSLYLFKNKAETRAISSKTTIEV